MVRTHIETEVPGLEIELILLMDDLIGDLTAVPQPIEIKLFSDDQAALMAVAPRVAAAIADIDGVVDINDGVLLAGSNRMRPILMTTLAAILALLPLAIALGQGSEMQQPLVVAIIAGLLVQIPLVTVVMPLVYRALTLKKYLSIAR